MSRRSAASNFNPKSSAYDSRSERNQLLSSKSSLPREAEDKKEDIPRIIELAHGSTGSANGSVSGLEDDEYESMIPSETRSYGSMGGSRHHVRKLFHSPPPSASASSIIQRSHQTNTLISKAVIYMCVLISDMCRGVLFPTLWLLIYSLGGTKATQGMVVAAFSAGRIVGSPFFGHLSEQYGYQKVLVCCNAIIIFGTFLYAISHQVWMVVFAQLVIGFGAGNLGATRGFIAEQTTVENRTSEMAFLTSIQYGGFTVTPIIGAMISSSFSDESRFAMPAAFIGGGAAICILLLILFFQDVHRSSLHSQVADPLSHADYDKLQRDESKGSFDATIVESTYFGEDENNPNDNGRSDNRIGVKGLMIAGCILNFVTKGVIAIFETLTVMFVSKHFQWDTIRLGITISVCGLFGVVILLCFPLILRYIQDTDLIIGGLALMLLSCLSLIQSLSPITSEQRVYGALILMFATGYPIGHTALIGVFSQLSKTGPQGKMMGIFGSFGSLARIVFPLSSGIVVQKLGFDWAFGFAAFMLSISLFIMICFRKSISSKVHDLNN